jgi:hypothetical protein
VAYDAKRVLANIDTDNGNGGLDGLIPSRVAGDPSVELRSASHANPSV